MILLAFFASGAAPAEPSGEITARSVPPIAEESWSFTDRGTVYFVGKTSGQVRFVRADTPSPDTEPEKPRPKPPPAPSPVTGVKWFSVIVDPDNAAQAAWRTNPELRAEVARRGIEFRSYLSTESDIDHLGFQQVVGSTGTPCVILQSESGKMLKVLRPQSLADIVDLVESLR